MRVLIVHRDRNLCFLLQEQCQDRGHEVILLGTLEEALILLHGARPPQFALLDIDVNTFAGQQFCQRLRDHPALEAISILCVQPDPTPLERVSGRSHLVAPDPRANRSLPGYRLRLLYL